LVIKVVRLFVRRLLVLVATAVLAVLVTKEQLLLLLDFIEK